MDTLPRFAWEPLTPRGIAAFSRTSVGRLWLVQFLVAGLVAASVVWLLYDGVFPTVRGAIRQLPAQGAIRSQRLEWPGESPVTLAEGRFLAITVDLEHSGDLHAPAHFQMELSRESFVVRSLFGYAEGQYPAGLIVAFNRPELQPWWGAWETPILGLTALGVIGSLMLCWQALATLYAVPVWLIGLYQNRELSLGGSWKLAGAALMPGALVMTVALVLYGLGALDLIHVVFAAAGHLVLGWIYLGISPMFLPACKETGETRKNPFASGSE